MKTAYTYILLLLLFPLFTKAQELTSPDSLSRVLNASKTDSLTLLDFLHKLDKMSTDRDEDRIRIANWIIKESSRSKNQHVLAKTYNSLGIIYLENKDEAQAADYFNKALVIAENNGYPDISLRILNSTGAMYIQFKQPEKAIACYEKALEVGKKSRDSLRIGLIYCNLATAYMENGHADKAIQQKSRNLILKGLEIARRGKDTAGMITINNNLSYVYIDLKQPDSALLVLKNNEALIIRFRIKDRLVTHYLRIGQAYEAKKQYREAIKNYVVGLEYAKQFGQPRWEYNYYLAMSDSYEELGDFKNANKYNKLYIQVHDSIVKVENFEAAEEIQNKYQQAKKEKEILRLNLDNEIKQLQLEKEGETKNRLVIIIIAIAVGLLLLGTLIIFLVRTNNERKKAYLKLQEKNIEIEAQSERLSEQSKLISRFQSQMNPHFVFNALNSIQGFVINDQKEKTILQLQRMSFLMRETISNSEKESIGLRNEIKYLEAYMDFEQEKFAKPVRFVISIPGDAEGILVPPMLIQPFIENAIKHAGFHLIADPFVKLSISVTGDLLEIRVTDNGKGIDPEKENVIQNSHAIAMIRSRLQVLFQAAGRTAVKDYFEIISKPVLATGTEIKFYVPLLYRY
ncbi:MAG: putative Signal transduction histidine kinase, LytS [Bacteroidetes bacterium]|nr:putative Signal transduction histidine kinase, LytS [Bacteroidota bacterium]